VKSQDAEEDKAEELDAAQGERSHGEKVFTGKGLDDGPAKREGKKEKGLFRGLRNSLRKHRERE
jgi:hypothetical protein